MAPAPTPSLPGVYFAAPAARRPLFPRLDVAGFVGYAERGPTDLAVAIEDPRQFSAVFGGEHVLARDEGSLPVFAHLPSAVRSFFANGGRRCHVVRVAGPCATPARFAVPGLIAVTSAGDPGLATIDAASVGAWANGATMSSRLDAVPMPPRAMASEPGRVTWRDGGSSGAIQPGDLLRLWVDGGGTWLASITRVAPLPTSPDDGRSRDLGIEIAAAWELGVDAGGALGSPRAVRRLSAGATSTIGVASGLRDTTTGSSFEIELDPGVDEPRPGDLVVLDPVGPAPGACSLVMSLSATRPMPVASPPDRRLQVDGDSVVALEARTLPTVSFGGFIRVERLRFELRMHAGPAGDVTVSDLAFGAGGPRSWLDVVLPESGVLPGRTASPSSSATITAAFETYRAGGRPRDQRIPALDRVTLSALLAPTPGAAGQTFLPVGVPAFLTTDASAAPGPIQPGNDDLSSHEPGPFVDAALAEVPPVRLLATALELATIDERRLDGIHALTFVDDVALVAVPDAAHRPWGPVSAVVPVPAPPVVPQAAPNPCVDDEAFEACDRPPTIIDVSPDSGLASVATPIVISGSGFLPGPVNVLIGGEPAGSIEVVRDDVLTCTVPGSESSPPHHSTGAVDVTVVTADGDATLEDAFTYVPDPIDPSLPALVPVNDADAAGLATLLPVQAALVRLCHGRADAVALLDLPAGYRVVEAVGWEADLRRILGLPAAPGPGDEDLPVDLSYAAAYHPWVFAGVAGSDAAPRAVPPSGSVAGLIAARELDRGAWIAPANDPLRGVQGLVPGLTRDEWAALFAARVNLVRREADDFRPMSAHTLSDVVHLRQISVRRLMILLRKAALEHGMDYVFETNHERFREGVGAMLRTLLRQLHEAGAFAGATPEESYLVDTGTSVNPPDSVDAGRFVALIQVAPSQPAEFLTVELTRTGQGVLQVSGA